ncbi:MAG: aspartyl/asparaginyl beta-hydroxylase domain-containing protein [Rhizobacter sp.]
MFIESTEFPFLAPLAHDWQSVRDELLALRSSYFMQWPERDIYQGNWSVFGLYNFGNRIDEHCALCPRTAKLVGDIPGLVTAGFSSLSPGTVIAPHVGYTNQVLRSHLGLVTPEGCAIRVGRDTRSWSPGSCFVFDDTTEHEAWNRGDSTRVVLLLDFKRDLHSNVHFPDRVLAYKPVSGKP